MKTIAVVGLTVTLVTTLAWAQTPSAGTSTANPELVGALAKELGSNTQQAEGAAGAMFSVAKSRLAPDEFSKVSAAVPGMDGLLKAAPAVGGVGGIGGAVAGASSLAGSFTKLGLKPEMVAKAVPVLTGYVTKTGGADVGKLLAGALK